MHFLLDKQTTLGWAKAFPLKSHELLMKKNIVKFFFHLDNLTADVIYISERVNSTLNTNVKMCQTL